jgi:hypothetical protein
MSKGIGYQEYRRKRLSEGLSASKIEAAGNERFLIYFGRAHVVDHETGTVARGKLKIGRGKFATALMRGRNQPGIDFRIYAELILENNRATQIAEDELKAELSAHNASMSQGQRELYDFADSELQATVDRIVARIKSQTNLRIIETNYYI